MERTSDRTAGTGRRRWRTAAAGVVLVAAGLGVLTVPGPAGAGAAVVSHQPGGEAGYRLVAGDGGVFAFGAPFHGSAAASPGACPPNTSDREMPEGECWSMAALPGGGGYWVLNAYNGVVMAFGAAQSYGNRVNGEAADLWPNSVAMAPTPTGRGYWILEDGLSGMGTVDAFGDAATGLGDEMSATGGTGVNGVPVAIVATPSGQGYWIADSDGGVFAFGDAAFYGSMGSAELAAPVVAMAATPSGHGYWLAAADGGVFAFGDAAFSGSLAGHDLNGPVSGIAADPSGVGYWLAATDGGVFAFGGAPFLGSMAEEPLTQPVFGITAAPAALPV